jgi:DNA replication protein DnaC
MIGPIRRRACFTGPVTEPDLLEPAEARAANPHLRGIGSSSCPYAECDGNGLVLEDSGDARPCRCRAERIARNRTRGLHSTIPERYRHVAFERAPVTDMEPQIVRHVRRFCERIETNLDEGRGLLFFGDPGTGKTTLAMLISQYAMRARRSLAIYTTPWLLARIASTYESQQETYIELMERLAAVDLLHIDDLAIKTEKEWTLQQLYTVINRRYEDKRSMVVTANLESPEEFADLLAGHIGKASASRLLEMCEPIPLFGHDRRRSG